MTSLNFADIYENPTIEQLAEKVYSYRSKLSNTQDDLRNKFLSSSPIKHALCGIGQVLSVYMSSLLISVPFLVVGYIAFSGILSAGKPAGVLLLIGTILYC
jgi:hypothetical protein